MTPVGNQRSKKTLVWLSRLLVALMVFALCVEVYAQQPGKLAQIGYLDGGTAAGSAEFLDAFRKQMIKLNWIEGKNFTIDYRYSEGKGPDRDIELAVELVRLKPDVIVVNN